MTSETDKESAAKLIDPTKSAAPVERASESVVAPPDYASMGRAKPPAIPAAAVSGHIELGQDVYPETPAEGVSIVPPPPSAVVTNTLQRGQQGMPLSTMVAITAGVIVVLVALSLLLFR